MDKKKKRPTIFFPIFSGRLDVRTYAKGFNFFYGWIGVLILVYAMSWRWLRYEYGYVGHISLAVVLSLLFLYAFLCLCSLHVRRLHDVGKRGYWVISPLFPFQKFFFNLDKEGEPGTNKWGCNPEESYDSSPSTGREGGGVQEKARQLYYRARRKNDAAAQFELGLCYYEGRMGVPRDKVQALRWIILARDNHSAEAQDFLEKL